MPRPNPRTNLLGMVRNPQKYKDLLVNVYFCGYIGKLV
jgi:hypothetical protein